LNKIAFPVFEVTLPINKNSSLSMNLPLYEKSTQSIKFPVYGKYKYLKYNSDILKILTLISLDIIDLWYALDKYKT